MTHLYLRFLQFGVKLQSSKADLKKTLMWPTFANQLFEEEIFFRCRYDSVERVHSTIPLARSMAIDYDNTIGYGSFAQNFKMNIYDNKRFRKRSGMGVIHIGKGHQVIFFRVAVLVLSGLV